MRHSAPTGADPVKRLRWRCRRGMRELDVLLEPYFTRRNATMTPADLQLFERFLDSSDMDLHAWLTRRSTPVDAKFAALVNAILDASRSNAGAAFP
ncbi:MAG: succinate dehydrogenase assembly factor 2 [Gammaproteobacteria bacterium]|nr:succinate dehydrogenase assembly factor 2 [Gammaproteobacteria bacterium]